MKLNNYSINEQIETFFHYLWGDFNEVNLLAGGNPGKNSSIRRYKKLLYISILDLLSKVSSPNNTSNRSRFITLIQSHSNWKDKNRVSLPHLQAYIEKYPQPKLANLKEHCTTRLKAWKPDQDNPISMDSDIAELQALGLWPSDHICPTGKKITLEHFRHDNLLYANRNSLIHEFNDRAEEFPSQIDDMPFYQSLEHLQKDTPWLGLVYPLRFYRELCEDCLISVKENHIANGIDPYSAFKFGPYLLEILNE